MRITNTHEETKNKTQKRCAFHRKNDLNLISFLHTIYDYIVWWRCAMWWYYWAYVNTRLMVRYTSHIWFYSSSSSIVGFFSSFSSFSFFTWVLINMFQTSSRCGGKSKPSGDHSMNNENWPLIYLSFNKIEIYFFFFLFSFHLTPCLP